MKLSSSTADTPPVVEDVSPKIEDVPPIAPKRGRPPKNSVAPKSSREVESALSILETVYTLLATGLLTVGAPESAGDLVEKIPTLQEQNRNFLAADLKLAQQIAKIGASTGRGGFFVVNAMALVPVIAGASKELVAKKQSTKSTPAKDIE